MLVKRNFENSFWPALFIASRHSSSTHCISFSRNVMADEMALVMMLIFHKFICCKSFREYKGINGTSKITSRNN